MVGTLLSMVAPSDRIGNYRLEAELAQTQHFALYRAVHQVLPRRALVKVMREPAVLLREAYILDALHHPGIIRVYETGLLADRRAWFATEQVIGSPIAGLMAPGAIDRVDAVAMLRDLATVLDHAHHRGIVVCGLRPDRVLLTSNRGHGFPLCVVDWSDARAHDARPLPFVAQPAGWHYLSPELAQGDVVDDRTDVYSLGVIAYELLCGMRPYDTEIATAIDGSKLHVPTEVRCADAPRELTHLVDTMLAFDRWDRPSITEVLGELTWLADALSAAGAQRSPLRIRRPRWTPAIQPTGDAAAAPAPARTKRKTKAPQPKQ